MSLRSELEAVASCELADVLSSWPNWTDEQSTRLARYLRTELASGLLSIEHGRESGNPLGAARADARRVLARIDGAR